MLNNITRESLPAGMALVETNDGRWYPAFTPLSETPGLVVLIDPFLIPPALEPTSDPRQGYACREEAIQAYCAWHEAVKLTIAWEKLAAHTEVYPERTSWYVDEIFCLTGDMPRLTCGMDVYVAVVVKRDGVCDVISTTVATLDEAVEALYQRVYEYCQEQALQRAS